MDSSHRRLGATAVRVAALVMALGVAGPAPAHDPRTVAKEFAHALMVEGAGRLELKYKSMHWNEPAYQRFMADEAVRSRVNAGVWNNLGTAELGFEINVAGQALPKGSHPFGLNLDGSDKFSLVFKVGQETKRVPLEVSAADVSDYLSFVIYPTAKPDTFVLEGRGGKFRGKATLTVPYLREHAPGAAPHH